MNVAVEEDLQQLADEAAQEYMRALPPEHFMEATDHATQRKITVESFDLIREFRPDIQCFNELLVQYRRGRRKKKFLGVVPDNMVVVHAKPIEALTNFTISLQPVGPLLVLEYVSKHNERKDYEDNFDKYEQDLKVPYYLLFYPDKQDLSVFRMVESAYVAVKPNASGRLAIPELELEVAVLDEWTRFWFRGELLPLPGDLLKRLNAAQDQLEAERETRIAAEKRAEAFEAELARMKEELAKRGST